MPKVEPSDSSYMPSLVEVKVGHTVGGLKELKKVSIPSSSREAVLLTGMTEVSLWRLGSLPVASPPHITSCWVAGRELLYDHVKKVLTPRVVLDFRERNLVLYD